MDAFGARIERGIEKRWLDAKRDDDLPGEVRVDLSSVPWQEGAAPAADLA